MKLSLSKILAIVATVLGLISVFMLFAPYAVCEVFGVKILDVTGLNAVFGTDVKVNPLFTESFGAREGKMFEFSIVDFFPTIFSVAGVVLAIIAIFGKGGKVVPIVAAVAFLVAGVFYFCAVQGLVLEGENEASKEEIKAIKDMFDLGAGAIVGGIFCILSAIASGVSLVFIKKAE